MTSDPIAVYYGTLKEGTITVTGDSSNWKRSARCLIMVNNISERWGIIPESVIMYKLAKVIPSTKFLTMTFLTSKNFTQPNDPVFTFSDNITDFNTISINSTRIAYSSYDSQAANTSLCFNICNSINIGEEYTITPSTYGEVFNYTIPLSADSDFITGSYTIPSERFLLIMAAYSSSTWDSTITATVELSSNITVENLHTTYQFVDSSSYSSYYAQTAIYIAECTSSNIGEEFTASISYGNDIKNPISPILVKL